MGGWMDSVYGGCALLAPCTPHRPLSERFCHRALPPFPLRPCTPSSLPTPPTPHQSPLLPSPSLPRNQPASLTSLPLCLRASVRACRVCLPCLPCLVLLLFVLSCSLCVSLVSQTVVVSTHCPIQSNQSNQIMSCQSNQSSYVLLD